MESVSTPGHMWQHNRQWPDRADLSGWRRTQSPQDKPWRHDRARRSTHWIRSRCDCTSPRHQRKENRSHRASGHRSASECDADKDLGKNGLHEGRSKSDESPTGSSHSGSYLRSRKNTNNGPPHGRTGSLDELPGGRESKRRRPIHFGQRFCQEFWRDDWTMV